MHHADRLQLAEGAAGSLAACGPEILQIPAESANSGAESTSCNYCEIVPSRVKLGKSAYLCVSGDFLLRVTRDGVSRVTLGVVWAEDTANGGRHGWPDL